ncbi:MAG: hypothetical protein VKJ46_15150 [Leptolyngbyaceae bacterium]|nr:hypothetical protein [Leptolyngbyaceae bacterium]
MASNPTLNPTPNPSLMQAVEKLGYRVTPGDVATQAGLDVNLAQRGLLALASDAGGHLQVAESGEVVYLFPKNFRAVMRDKFWRLRWKERWQKIWRVLFYIIRISFGIALIVSIVLILVTIVVILIALNSNRDNDERSDSGRSGGGGAIFMPHFWIGPDWFWFFSPNYGTYDRRYDESTRRLQAPEERQMNFLEAVFSFLFGDGDPNANLEDRRWKAIATVIRNHKGAVAAEQIAPYLDETGTGYAQEYEDYMLPVLTRFNGRPEVSPDGAIVYHFPELQTTVAQQRPRSIAPYLEEETWQFSHATSGQIGMAIGLGVLNFVAALALAGLLGDGAIAAELGGLVAFTQSIMWLLLGYGTGFLTIPIIRYFWLKRQNQKIAARNQQRQARVRILNQANPDLQKKLAYAQQFAAETVIRQQDLVYTTETDLLDQEASQTDRIDAEWQRRLNQSNP